MSNEDVDNTEIDLDLDDEIFEWKYGWGVDYLIEEEINPFHECTQLKSHAMICNFVSANVEGDINYSHHDFVLRQTLGHWYPTNNSDGVFCFKFTLNILGWIEDTDIKSKLECSDVLKSNNIQLLNLCYQLGEYLSHSYVQLPHAHSYNKCRSPEFIPSDFMNFSHTMKSYHLTDSGGSYISRYQLVSSHIELTLLLDEKQQYYLIYLTTIILDFMIYHLDRFDNSIEAARRNF